MNKAYLGLGSNMGDKKRYLYDAIQILNHHEQICPQLVVKEKKVQDWAQNFNQEALKIISSK